ncbi:substrate-binding periplasmic protein [Eleftheria terrae]|uniref:substrate-binding periplasmic protein n=1 Tax=Eleftheria terrae TaxID=1597781 RepID=UPI00263AD332|nr:transporter substrate-binding domain-containing protein [Eleftheria terrae]WKB53085.1 hypothetical protein N7L95_01380 [Eleftheria terrae]
MKKSLLLALLVLLAPACRLAVAQKVQVQAVTEATPYTFLRNGKVAGPATEIVEMSLERAGLSDWRISLYPWARALDLARNEPNVLIFLIARTPQRESQFKWVGEFMKMEYHLYRLKDRREVTVGRLEDARNFSVGVTRDDLRHQYLQGKGFTKIVVSAHNIDNFRKLLAGQIQLIPLPENDLLDLCAETRTDCARIERVLTLDELSASLYMAYGLKTSDELVERTRVGFLKVKADGTVGRLMRLRP